MKMMKRGYKPSRSPSLSSFMALGVKIHPAASQREFFTAEVKFSNFQSINQHVLIKHSTTETEEVKGFCPEIIRNLVGKGNELK